MNDTGMKPLSKPVDLGAARDVRQNEWTYSYFRGRGDERARASVTSNDRFGPCASFDANPSDTWWAELSPDEFCATIRRNLAGLAKEVTDAR